MKQAVGNRRSAIALWAALVLAVHAFLNAWAGAAMAGQPMYDAFGNPLCITNTVNQDGGTGDHGKLPNCCAFGCAVTAVAVPEPPSLVSEVLTPPAIHVDFPAIPPQRSPRVGLRSPGSPRAPPLHL